MVNTNGKPKIPASHLPKSAPINPRAIETRQPPREEPAIACPIEPHIDAIISKKRISNFVIFKSYNWEFLKAKVKGYY